MLESTENPFSEVLTCSLHACLVLDAVKNVALAILVSLLKNQGCDLNQEAGKLSLHCSEARS